MRERDKKTGEKYVRRERESGLLVNLGGQLLEERLEGHGGVGLVSLMLKCRTTWPSNSPSCIDGSPNSSHASLLN